MGIKYFLIVIAAIIFFLSTGSTVMAQGQLFTKENADELFGVVEVSVAIETSKILNLAEKTNSKLMFGIYNNGVVVLDNQRNVLFSEENYQIKSDAEFYVYSVSVIKELLEKGMSNITVVERREKVLSITNGNTTMEVGSVCPPYCE